MHSGQLFGLRHDGCDWAFRSEFVVSNSWIPVYRSLFRGAGSREDFFPLFHPVVGAIPTLSEREASHRMLNSIKRFWKDESGQGLVEYALILFLIAIVVIVALTTLGKKTNNVLANVGAALNS